MRRGALRVACALVLATWLIGASGCGDLSRQELSRGVESLGAIAAEGRLVADGVARDATKSTYARVMSKTLGGAGLRLVRFSDLASGLRRGLADVARGSVRHH